MLTEKEKDGAIAFLSTEFHTQELLSIVETVTSRMVTVRTKHEAIKAIILHSETAIELLRRKKVKKECIFRHLASRGVGVSTASDKEVLIRQLLAYWLWGTKDGEQRGSGDNQARTVSRAPQVAVPKTPQVRAPQVPQFGAPQVPQFGATQVPQFGAPQVPQFGAPQTVQVVLLQNLQLTVPHETHIQTLAEQFATWFYQQLNALHQADTNHNTSEWGPRHFWDDAKLNLRIHALDRREETFHGAELVAKRLQSLICNEGLVFNPNVSSEGIRGRQDRHGLIGVVVCGTVHRGSECLGWFEQRFGLIRDPLKKNNYKIKFTDLNMKEAIVQRMPTLTSAENPAIRM